MSWDSHVIQTKRYLKMSDSEESMSTMPVLQKRPKISLPTNTDGSGDDQVKNKIISHLQSTPIRSFIDQFHSAFVY